MAARLLTALLDLVRPPWRHSDPGVRVEAIRALDQRLQARALRGRRNDPKGRGAERVERKRARLLKRIIRQDPHPDVTAAAARELRSPLHKDFFAAEGLSHRHAGVRCQSFDSYTPQQVLVGLLRDDPAASVRKQAAAWIGDVEALAAALRSEASPEVRQSIVENLGQRRRSSSENVYAVLRRVAAEDADPKVRRAAAEAACEHSWRDAGTRTNERLRDPRYHRRGDYTETYRREVCDRCGKTNEELVDVYEHGDG